MINDYKKHELFGRTLIQRIVLMAPFKFDFPVAEQACFIYVREGNVQYQTEEQQISLNTNYSLLLNCVRPGKQLTNVNSERCEVVIVSFYPDILKKVYDRELPSLFRASEGTVSIKSSERINTDFLIQKYIEGLLFYFENPSLISEEILVLKLREIVLLLSQTQNAETLQIVLSQLFSPASYIFRQIIEANIFSSLTIEQLAEHCSLSVSSFKREFAKLYNETPAVYIKNKKLQKAAELLEVSDQRISEIAFECGFNDLAGFTKSFSEKYNATPTEYRKKFKTDSFE